MKCCDNGSNKSSILEDLHNTKSEHEDAGQHIQIK